MDQSTHEHVVGKTKIGQVEITARFWRDENCRDLHSVICIEGHPWYLQVNADSSDLRRLGLMLVQQAEALEKATKHAAMTAHEETAAG